MLTLAEWRRAKNISQDEMAKVCGVHVNTYRRWEEHPEEVKVGSMEKIADRIGVSITDIIFLPDDTTKGNK